MPAVLLLVSQGLAILPSLIRAGMTVGSLVNLMRGVIDRGEVTDDDWAQLRSIEEQLRTKLHSDTV